MRDFDESTLWRVSEYERVTQETGTSGFTPLVGRSTMLPSEFQHDLRVLEKDMPNGIDPLEVVATALRHREPALLCLGCEDLVWPVTIFPNEKLAHCPRDMSTLPHASFGSIKLLACEPPGVRPPGHWMHERVGQAELYRPLEPLLWLMALYGPRTTVLADIGGTAAYRAVYSHDQPRPPVSGIVASAMEHLRRESVPMRTLATWPGMNVERAARLLNGLYVTSGLLVTRAHPAARAEPGAVRRLLGGLSSLRR
jgi:hypothetical protein